ncbi:hypothetical protein E4U13_002914, partial [Claviceps humidiphila]
MGQYWEIAALDSKTLLRKGWLKLGEFLFDCGVSEGLERALAVPVVPTYDSGPENVKSHHSAAGVTNQYFWSIAREYVVRDFMQSLGVWAGQQLITVGDYVKVDDHPPGLFATEEDKETLLKRRPEDDEADDEESEDELYRLPEEQQTLTLYDRVRRSFTELPRARYRTSDFDGYYSILGALAQDTCYRTVKDVFSMKRDDFYPRDEVWILRNLTTQ